MADEMKLLQGDCLEVMQLIPDESVDLVLTDPPYNVGVTTEKNGKETKMQWDRIPDYCGWTQLLCGDCLDLMKQIPNNSVDMVLCDLPYGVTDLEWDDVIPTNRLFDEYRRICKQNANVVLFCQQPFTTELVSKTYKTEFSHMLVWAKNTKTRAKSSKTVPMAQYEEIVVFRINKVGNKGNHLEIRQYFNTELSSSGFTVKQIEEKINNRAAHHFFGFSSDFRIPTKEVYERLQAETERFRKPYEEIRVQFDAERKNRCTYNPPQNNTNLLFYDVPCGADRVHPTQKPVPLLEHLILAYSNTGETVLDNCMGSGSTGVACLHTGRRFIGIEKDEKYFELAKSRIEQEERDLIEQNKQAAGIDADNCPDIMELKPAGCDLRI